MHSNMNVKFKNSIFCLQSVFNFLSFLEETVIILKVQAASFFQTSVTTYQLIRRTVFIYRTLNPPITNSDHFVTEHQTVLFWV